MGLLSFLHFLGKLYTTLHCYTQRDDHDILLLGFTIQESKSNDNDTKNYYVITLILIQQTFSHARVNKCYIFRDTILQVMLHLIADSHQLEIINLK